MFLYVYRFKIRKEKENDFILEDSTKIPLTMELEVLGKTIESDENIYSHLKQLCKEIANKLNALTRITPYFDKKHRELFGNSSFKGKLSYCSLIWNFCSVLSRNRKKER